MNRDKENRSKYKLVSLIVSGRTSFGNNKGKKQTHYPEKAGGRRSCEKQYSIDTTCAIKTVFFLDKVASCFFFLTAFSCAFLILFSSSESSASFSCSYSWTTNQPASLLSANLINFCRLRITYRDFSKDSVLAWVRLDWWNHVQKSCGL